ncbi:MAG TPA: amino acid racemase [Terriglobales bacterium]|jgi:aspartate racemase
MKTLGMIGGIGPESTIDYYRAIIAAYRKQISDDSYPSIIINSINLTKAVGLVTANELEALADFLLAELGRLARAGASIAFLAANTPHIVFHRLQPRSPIPLVSIVEAACGAAKAKGFQKVGLFGTRFTMQGQFYPEVFTREGIALVVPDAADQEQIHNIYMNELLKNIFLPESRAVLLAIIDRLREKSGMEGLLLAGTELPLILRNKEHNGIPLLDTTVIHAEAAVAEMLR